MVLSTYSDADDIISEAGYYLTTSNGQATTVSFVVATSTATTGFATTNEDNSSETTKADENPTLEDMAVVEIR